MVGKVDGSVAPAVKANAEAAAVATWKAPPDVPGRPNQAPLRPM